MRIYSLISSSSTYAERRAQGRGERGSAAFVSWLHLWPEAEREPHAHSGVAVRSTARAVVEDLVKKKLKMVEVVRR
jgi:hypothetical protein